MDNILSPILPSLWVRKTSSLCCPPTSGDKTMATTKIPARWPRTCPGGRIQCWCSPMAEKPGQPLCFPLEIDAGRSGYRTEAPRQERKEFDDLEADRSESDDKKASRQTERTRLGPGVYSRPGLRPG